MKIVHGTEVLTTVEEWIDPKRTAIAVIDMQNEIVCEQGGYARQGIDTSPIRAIVPSIQRLLDAARRVGVVVAFAEYIHRNRLGANMVDGANYYRNKDCQWVPCIQEGTWGLKPVKSCRPIHETSSSSGPAAVYLVATVWIIR